MKEKLKCNIIFQKEQEYNISDTRFTKVKIWLMHLGENHNGSYFDKVVVKDAIPTLSNTPILGYVMRDENGDKDFAGHENEIKEKNGKIIYKYKGNAYGVIPEENNAHFEKRLCDDGIEREFLVVDGLLWNKLHDGIDILNRDVWKSQSMELSDNENDYEGEYDQNGIYHFKKFKFYGACFLGDKYLPAMEDARIELNYSKIHNDIKKQLKKFNEFIKNERSHSNMDNLNKNIHENDVKTDKKNELSENLKNNENIPNNFQLELKLKEKEKKIIQLNEELKMKNKDLEKITNEFSQYKRGIELEKKKELLDKYLDILHNNKEYKELLDENKINEFSIERLQERLNSLIGKQAFDRYNSNKETDIDMEKNLDTKHYFDQENNINLSINQAFGGLVDRLMSI